jgi:hypothetical protein
MGTGTPAMSALTTWLCLRIWGVTFFLESFCLGETYLDPGLFGQPVYGPENGLGAQMAGVPAREEPLLARQQALSDGLQSLLAHPGGPEMAGLGPAALNPDESVMKIDVRDAGGDQLPHPAAQVIETEEYQSVSTF